MNLLRPRLVLILLMAVIGGGLSYGQTTAEIRLRNRTFTPQPGIAADLKELLAAPDTVTVHVLVQLWRTPDGAMREDLAARGIALQQYLGGTAYLAAFSQEVDYEVGGELVRWAGLLEPQDKMDAALWLGDFQDWSGVVDSRVMIVVRFFDGVTRGEAHAILRAYSNSIEHHGPGASWAIVVEPESIRALAGHGAVRWLEEGPKPMMPLGEN